MVSISSNLLQVPKRSKRFPAKGTRLEWHLLKRKCWVIHHLVIPAHAGIQGKIYRIIPDPRAAKDDLVRIVDESGEDYLYHKSYFLFVDFPSAVTKRILALEHAS